MKERSWVGLEPSDFRLYPEKAERFFGWKWPDDPVREAVCIVALTYTSIGFWTLVSAWLHRPATSPVLAIALIAPAFVGRSYNLLNPPEERRSPVETRDEMSARLDRCRTAGLILLLGAFLISWFDSGWVYVVPIATLLCTVLFLLRIRVIRRSIRNDSPSTLPSEWREACSAKAISE